MGRGRLKTPSALFWAYSAERNLLFAVSKLPFHGKGRNGEQVLKTADCLCNPCCENGVQESPQTFLNPKILNDDSSECGRSAAAAISDGFTLWDGRYTPELPCRGRCWRKQRRPAQTPAAAACQRPCGRPFPDPLPAGCSCGRSYNQSFLRPRSAVCTAPPLSLIHI